MSFYICPRCGNQDESYLGKKKDGSLYCRRCISFQGEEVQEKPLISPNISLVLNYSLTPFQKELSDQIIKNYLLGKDTLIHAVCGAGKTELIFGVIETCLKQGGHPGFAVPRKDVAKELYTRFQEAFPNAKCVLVYGDHHEELVGDIILLTTHQLYRYPHYFDLLIVDEIDAFPYKGNFVLSSFLKKAVKGRLVLMSATPPEDVLEEFTKENHEILHLNARFHLSPIPVPKFHEWFLFFQRVPIIFYLKKFQKEGKPTFVFVPTIGECECLGKFLSLFVKGGNYVHSKKEDREQIIDDFRKGKYMYLVTTSVLERGVTVKNLQVLVYHADEEEIYDAAALIQIAGRVGRKKNFEEGNVIFFGERKTKAIKEAIKEIEKTNGDLQGLLQKYPQSKLG